MAGDIPPAWQISYAPAAMQMIRLMAERASDRGLEQEYATALRTIQEALSTDPLGWGDPSSGSEASNIRGFGRAHSGLYLTYAVDQRRRYVYVRTVAPLPGSPYDPEAS